MKGIAACRPASVPFLISLSSLPCPVSFLGCSGPSSPSRSFSSPVFNSDFYFLLIFVCSKIFFSSLQKSVDWLLPVRGRKGKRGKGVRKRGKREIRKRSVGRSVGGDRYCYHSSFIIYKERRKRGKRGENKERERGGEISMGLLFLMHLEGKIYSCKHCQTHLGISDDILSRVGAHRRGLFPLPFRNVVSIF